MIESNDRRLEAELIGMMQGQPRALNLDEIFCLLYDRRERLPELMAMTRERTLEMRRLKRNLDQSVYRGLVETSWENGQMYYRTRNVTQDFAGSFQLSVVRDRGRITFASRPYHFQIGSNRNDRLLVVFCVIALFVLALIGYFLVLG